MTDDLDALERLRTTGSRNTFANALLTSYPALLSELRALREDAERLDALQSMTTGYGIGWVLRLSSNGRGMRLHETNSGTAFATVRAAIDAARRKP